MSALDAVIGRDGEPPRCKILSDNIVMHWFAIGAQPGDACLCGDTVMKREAPDDE